MATPTDADLVLKLYDLRRESRMREAREWVMTHFNPKSLDEIIAMQRDLGSEHNQFWRQVIGYWEMAASFVLRDALDGDLFLDSTSENLFLLAKFWHFRDDYLAAIGSPLLPNTAALLDRFPAARQRFDQLVIALAARAVREQQVREDALGAALKPR
jgi:hypothetical protein